MRPKPLRIKCLFYQTAEEVRIFASFHITSFPNFDGPNTLALPSEMLHITSACLPSRLGIAVLMCGCLNQFAKIPSLSIAASPTQRPKLSSYHDIHHRMVQWQAI